MKKSIFCCLLAMAVLIAGCGAQDVSSEESTAETISTETATDESDVPETDDLFVPGTYEGSSVGRNGDIVVSVTVSENEILDIDIVSENETAGLGDRAVDDMVDRVLQYQDLAVDTVAGATISSYAARTAISNALEQAVTGDISLLKTYEAEEAQDQSLEGDLIIVGAGASGTALAVRAAELDPDLNIILLEKNSYIGGNALVSEGYLEAINPPEELACESSEALTQMLLARMDYEPTNDFEAELLEASWEKYEEYLQGDQTYIFYCAELELLYFEMENPILENQALQLAGLEKCTEVLEWFYDHGANFAPLRGIAGFSYPSFTYFTDHYAGTGYFEIFEEELAGHENITLMTETTATQLITENDAVTGVMAQGRDGSTYTITAPVVVLATGGFAADSELVQENAQMFDGELPENILTDTRSTNTGDGIYMAQEVGAAVDEMDNIQLIPLANPYTGDSHDIVGMDGILVNNDGYRTVDESLGRNTISMAMFQEEDDCMWLISDSVYAEIDEDGYNMFGQNVETMISRGYLYRADTLEELAEMTGINAEQLVATVDAYNAAARGEQEDEMGRIITGGEMNVGPYYAMLRKPAVHFTMGGVCRNDDMQVLNEQGEIIEGLYAIGEVAINFAGLNIMGESFILAEQLCGD